MIWGTTFFTRKILTNWKLYTEQQQKNPAETEKRMREKAKIAEQIQFDFKHLKGISTNAGMYFTQRTDAQRRALDEITKGTNYTENPEYFLVNNCIRAGIIS